MMKNLSLVRLENAPDKNAFLEAAYPEFYPCSPHAERSWGFVHPFDTWSDLLLGQSKYQTQVEEVGKHLLLSFMEDKKVIPAKVLDLKVQQKVAEITESSGRVPGRKETREIKEEIRASMLPSAYTNSKRFTVWFDLEKGRLVMDSATNAYVDEITTRLSEALPDLGMRNFNISTSFKMAQWLANNEAESPFYLGDNCLLKQTEDKKTSVKYSNHFLGIQEVEQHIMSGKRPASLELSWGDRLSFILTDSFQIKSLKTLASSNTINPNVDSVEAQEDYLQHRLFLDEVSEMLDSLIDIFNDDE